MIRRIDITKPGFLSERRSSRILSVRLERVVSSLKYASLQGLILHLASDDSFQ